MTRPPEMGRNMSWERWFLRQAVRHTSGDPAFAEAVADGLEKGKAVYGDNAYLTRDNSLEGMDEARDAAAYVLMEYQRPFTANADEADEFASKQYLGEALRLAVQLDNAFRMARYMRACAERAG